LIVSNMKVKKSAPPSDHSFAFMLILPFETVS
jgi:hypothetical protein